jgi:hypothetical protein
MGEGQKGTYHYEIATALLRGGYEVNMDCYGSAMMDSHIRFDSSAPTSRLRNNKIAMQLL